MSSKTEKKTWKISESGGYFQILTHDNYEQTNGIQLELFYTSHMMGILQQTKELSITHFFLRKLIVLRLKVEKKPWKSWAYFSNFKCILDLSKCQQNGIFYHVFYF